MSNVATIEARWDGIAAALAICNIAILMTVALLTGHNGHMLYTSIALIAAVGGYTTAAFGKFSNAKPEVDDGA